MFKTNSQSQKRYSTNKQHLSANGFSLLPLALRPCLLKLSILMIVPVSLGGLVISTILYSNIAYATASTLSMTVSDNSLAIDIRPISQNGTFANSSNITISANTNNYTGYTLKIAAKTIDDRTLSDKVNNDNPSTFSSIESPILNTTFADNTSAGAAYNNKWGYLPSRYCTTTELNNTPTITCGNNNNTYLPAPDIAGDVLDITSTANNSNVVNDDNDYTITIGARANVATKAASYEGTFVIQMIANAIPYTVTYDKNTTDTVTNMPENIGTATYDETITISSNMPVRTGYKFLGWCDTQPTNNDDIDTCNGIIYNPNGDGTNLTYTLDQTADGNGLVLYGMWRPYIITWDNNYSGANLPADEKTYGVGTISELPTPIKPSTKCGDVDCYLSFKEWNTRADGEGDTVVIGTVITSNITYYAIWNLNSNTLQATTNDNTSCTGTKYDARDGKAYDVTIINSNNNDYCYTLDNLALDKGITLRTGDSDITPNDTYNTFTTPTENWASSGQNYYCKAIMAMANGEYYYNWYAAKANPYQCADPTSNVDATIENDSLSLGSICPAGWKMPDYKNDIIPDALWDSGNNLGELIASGVFSGGGQGGVGGYGSWWGSYGGLTGGSGAYGLRFFGGGGAIYSAYDKSVGFSVRCMRSS